MCVCEVCTYANIIHEYLISARNIFLELLDPNDKGFSGITYVDNSGNRYSKYRDEVIPDRKFINEKSLNDAYATMYPSTIQDK